MTALMRIGVLALQGDFALHAKALQKCGAEAVEVRKPEQLDAIDGLIIPGGESTTMSHLLETSGLLEPLSERLQAGMPAFGTCAGMILLAREVADGRPDQHRFGAIDIEFRDAGLNLANDVRQASVASRKKRAT